MKKLLILFILIFLPLLCGCFQETQQFKFIKTEESVSGATYYEHGLKITEYVGTKKEVVIPNEIDGIKVVAITPNFISSLINKGVKKISIPDSVYRITSGDVDYPKNLNNIYPDGKIPFIENENGLTYIDGWLIGIDVRNKNIVIKDGTRGIKDCILYYHDDLSTNDNIIETIHIPGSIKVIPYHCFFSNTFVNLKRVTIEEGVKKIEEYAFSLSNNPEIIVPCTVDYMGYKAISYNCKVIKPIHITFIINDIIEVITIDYLDDISIEDIESIPNDQIIEIYYDDNFTQLYNNEKFQYNTILYIKTKISS